MGGVPVIEEADEIVVDNPVLGRQEVEVDKLSRRPDEPLREPQLSAQLLCVFYDLTRRFCLKYSPRNKYAGGNTYGAKKNLVPGNFDDDCLECSPREEVVEQLIPMVAEQTCSLIYLAHLQSYTFGSPAVRPKEVDMFAVLLQFTAGSGR